MATTNLTKDDGQFLNFTSFMSIDSFMKNGILKIVKVTVYMKWKDNISYDLYHI